MKIGIACDHRGVTTKNKIISYLENIGYEVVDYGTNSEESVHYPTYAFKVGKEVVNGNIDFGVLLCGTGIGMSIACNKVKGVRCAKVDSKKDAYYARNDNNANVVAICQGLPFTDIKNILNTFFETEFSKEMRHNLRVQMIDDYV